MGYVGSTNNVVTNGAGSYLFALKEALAPLSGVGGAGWQVLQSSTGLAAPVTGDAINSAATFGNSHAWVRIQEPQVPGGIGQREYILQNGTALNGTAARIKYSRASGFTTGGTQTTAPNTNGGDGVVIVGTGTDANPTQAVNWCTATGYCHAVASNTPSPGVYGGYAFYLFGYTINPVTTPIGMLMTEAVAPGSTSSLDQDPMYRYGTGVSTAEAASASFLIGKAYTNAYPGLSWWEAYGLPGATYRVGGSGSAYNARTPASTNYFDTASILTISPYDGKEAMYPALMGRSGITSIAGLGPTIIPKGFSTGMLMYYASHNLLDTFNLNTADPRVAILVPGGATLPGVAIPWLTGITPAV